MGLMDYGNLQLKEQCGTVSLNLYTVTNVTGTVYT